MSIVVDYGDLWIVITAAQFWRLENLNDPNAKQVSAAITAIEKRILEQNRGVQFDGLHQG